MALAWSADIGRVFLEVAMAGVHGERGEFIREARILIKPRIDVFRELDNFSEDRVLDGVKPIGGWRRVRRV